ncbi:RNA polymerase II elongation factor ELL2-like [Rhynochetos jubatus]
MNPAHVTRRIQKAGSVSQRPYRDRVIHLLALKGYKKPELLARLLRDGIHEKDRNCLASVLQQVATLNPEDNTYALKDSFFKEVQRDWPGYDEADRRALELILSRKLNSPGNATSPAHSESPGTSERDVPSTTPQKRPLNSDVSPPVTHKKQRISRYATPNHLPSSGRLPASNERPPPALLSVGTVAPLWMLPILLPTSDPPHAASSISSNGPEARGTAQLEKPSCWDAQEALLYGHDESNSHSVAEKAIEQANLQWFAVGQPPGTGKSLVLEKHEEWIVEPAEERSHALFPNPNTASVEKVMSAPLFTCNKLRVQDPCSASADPPSPSEEADYCTKYTAIVSHEQRRSYEADFDAEFGEYTNLYACMQRVTEKFRRLDAQRRLLSPGSREYQVWNAGARWLMDQKLPGVKLSLFLVFYINLHFLILEEEILEEYRKLQQVCATPDWWEASPSYSEQKYRCKYLHNKLSHIQRLIWGFDRRQAESRH